jgi:hypothetical protein
MFNKSNTQYKIQSRVTLSRDKIQYVASWLYSHLQTVTFYYIDRHTYVVGKKGFSLQEKPIVSFSGML